MSTFSKGNLTGNLNAITTKREIPAWFPMKKQLQRVNEDDNHQDNNSTFPMNDYDKYDDMFFNQHLRSSSSNDYNRSKTQSKNYKLTNQQKIPTNRNRTRTRTRRRGPRTAGPARPSPFSVPPEHGDWLRSTHARGRLRRHRQ